MTFGQKVVKGIVWTAAYAVFAICLILTANSFLGIDQNSAWEWLVVGICVPVCWLAADQVVDWFSAWVESGNDE